MKAVLSGVQQMGRAFMLPIAVLPIAGLLLRLGQPDLLDIPAIAAAGDAIFSNLGLLFAIGIAIGLARENHGAAGLAAVVCYLVTTKGAEALIDVPGDVLAGIAGTLRDFTAAAWKARVLAKLSVPAGLLSGIAAGLLYNRYSEIQLPSYLAFFGGRRFVPIASGFAGLLLAGAFGFGWPLLERGMDLLSRSVLGAGEIGLFVYGVLNRILIITGLHHILNNLAWFLVGDFQGVTGDLKRFFAGDPDAGAFMSGFFPVMMFGLPATCLAMYHAAPPGRRRAVGGLLLSMALTSFLTGVTEPIEFTFLFLAPALYAVHAVLTGTAMVLMDLFRVRLGFGFSAGLFDYLLNYSKASQPLLMLPVGVAYFAVYYGVFRYVIRRYDLRTPGREPADTYVPAAPASARPAASEHAASFIEALGGGANVVAVDACMTRLRVTVADQAAVDDAKLKRLGARGVVRLAPNSLQVVVGPTADQLAGDMRRRLRADALTTRPSTGTAISGLLAALGGRANIRGVELASTRLLVGVRDAAAVNDAGLRGCGARGVVKVGPGNVQVLVGPEAAVAAKALQQLLIDPDQI
jgi:PTS system N-acetylglucosamine-specific IIC component